MNAKQKKIIVFISIIIFLSFLIWIFYGMEYTTYFKTIPMQNGVSSNGNPLLAVKEKFVWGLDLSLFISGATLIIGGILYMREDKKKK